MHQQEIAIFAAGCFWGTQHAFDKIPGVLKTTAGYCGGHSDNPIYADVRTGLTGHAEVVEVVFNPQTVPYSALLDAFFAMHNPTELNRQGPDIGTQYRSSIFAKTPEQCQMAMDRIQFLDEQKTFGAPIVTRIECVTRFWPAEDYHQKYFEKNPETAMCGVNL